jgi:tetratricopeptide (TPR) repeat protein
MAYSGIVQLNMPILNRHAVRIGWFFFFLLIGSLACCGIAKGQVNPQVAQLVTKAANLNSRGDYDGAAALYRQALGLTPNDSDLYTNLGQVLTNKGAYADAADVYEKSVAILTEKGPRSKLQLFNT